MITTTKQTPNAPTKRMTTLAAVRFEQIFPSFEAQIQTLHDLLIPVAAVLMITGFISTLRFAYTPRSMLRAMMVIVLITATIALLPDWLNIFQKSSQTVVAKMDASPQNAAKRYIELIIQKQSDTEASSSLINFRLSTFSDMIVTGILKVIGIIAAFIIWVAYVLQKFLLGFAYALAPIFLGMFALRSTSSIATRYLMSTVGLLLWPLGWAAASIGTSNLIDIFTNQGLAGFGPAYSAQSTLGAGVIGLWIIISTFIAPVIIQSVIASGANFGTALVGGSLTGAADAGKSAAGAAFGLSTGGAGLALAGAGAAVAIGSSAVGTTMRGGGRGFTGGTLQNLAPRLGASRAGSSTGDSTSGSSASASSGKRTESSASSLPTSDLTGDQQATDTLSGQSLSSRSPGSLSTGEHSTATSLSSLASDDSPPSSDLSNDQQSADLLEKSKNKLS
ncbi:MAG: hypothetical protein ACQKBY_08370 [Verrucomicrobiales bacterium]